MAHKFRDLKVWQRSMTLVEAVYELSSVFPTSERFGLTSQLRRAATSVPLNIAEGAGNDSEMEFRRFLGMARRSTYELSTALEIARRLGYCTEEQTIPLLEETDQLSAMLNSLMRTITQRTKLHEAQASFNTDPTDLTTDY